MAEQEFKHLLRIANTDINGNKPIGHALKKIKGVSFMFANMICHLANVDKYIKAGYLSDKQIERIDDIIKSPKKYNAPFWMLNRRKDPETGEDIHVVMGELKFSKESDIRSMKKIRCYKGMRHAFGLPVRGQRTRSNFRKNKGRVQGVQRKAVIPVKSEDDKKGSKGRDRGKKEKK